jgi:hypothetical protein
LAAAGAAATRHWARGIRFVFSLLFHDDSVRILWGCIVPFLKVHGESTSNKNLSRSFSHERLIGLSCIYILCIRYHSANFKKHERNAWDKCVSHEVVWRSDGCMRSESEREFESALRQLICPRSCQSLLHESKSISVPFTW